MRKLLARTRRAAAPGSGPGVRERVVRVGAALAVLCAAALTGLGPGAGSAAASPLPMSKCTTTSGVVLAVDFSHWGGPLLRSCGTTPTTGYSLLNQGGWQTTGTQHDGPGFICRIGYAGYQGGKQYPTSKDEACVLTPPATAYWSYWHADPGQNSWSYSQLGAMSYHPKPGSVDLWIFGATNTAGTQGRPTFSPDSVRAHNASPGGGGSSSGGSGGGSASGGGSGGGSQSTATHRPVGSGGAKSGATAGAKSGGKSTASPSPSSGTPTPTPTPTQTSTAGGGLPTPGGRTAGASPTPSVMDADPTASAHHSNGSVLPVAITAGVVAVIGGATVVQVRRRRRAE